MRVEAQVPQPHAALPSAKFGYPNFGPINFPAIAEAGLLVVPGVSLAMPLLRCFRLLRLESSFPQDFRTMSRAFYRVAGPSTSSFQA